MDNRLDLPDVMAVLLMGENHRLSNLQDMDSYDIIENSKKANYNSNHSSTLLLSKSNFFLYDSSDGGSRRVKGPSSL